MKKLITLILALALTAATFAQSAKKPLIVYFSRYGNTDFAPNVDATSSASIVAKDGGREGSTEHIARMIQSRTGGDIELLRTKQKYDADFNAVVRQNRAESEKNAFPALEKLALNPKDYDTVFIGYPIWNMTTPRAVQTFLRNNDLSGKTVIPFCTHDGYGSGSSYADIKKSAPKATVREGLAVGAKEVADAKKNVDAWLTKLGFAEATTAVTITAGAHKISGILYDTPLANEIKAHFPVTVRMYGYGGREYYGSPAFTPKTSAKGQYRFDDGDITYCAQNNSLAIFYSQTNRPNLTMEVVPIGRVMSDISMFASLGSNAEFTFEIGK